MEIPVFSVNMEFAEYRDLRIAYTEVQTDYVQQTHTHTQEDMFMGENILS